MAAPSTTSCFRIVDWASVKVILEAGRLGREALQLLVKASITPRRLLKPAMVSGPAARPCRAGQ